MHHVLACISPTAPNQLIIETAKAEAAAHSADWTTVFIEDSAYKDSSPESKRRVKKNIRLAESYGSDIETLFGDDKPQIISEFARLINADLVVLSSDFYQIAGHVFHDRTPEKLGSLLPDVNILVIPDQSVRKTRFRTRSFTPQKEFLLWDIVIIALIMLATTLIGLAFHAAGFDENTIIPLYSLAVLLCCMTAPSWAACIGSTVISILIFNYLFATPGGSFLSFRPSNWITYVVMFLTSLSIGFLTSATRRHSAMAAASTFQEKTLFETNEKLSHAKCREDTMDILVTQINKLTRRTVLYFTVVNGEPVEQKRILGHDQDSVDEDALAAEKAVLLKAYRTRQLTGASVLGDSTSRFLYLPTTTAERVLGVAAIELGKEVLDPLESSIVRAMVSKSATTSENLILTEEMEEAKTKASNEELKANLLRAISHDLRTPLTSITGTLDNLMKSEGHYSKEERQKMYGDAYSNSMWLNNMVENLLSASRLEDETIIIKPNIEILGDIIENTLYTIRQTNQTHPIEYVDDGELLFVNVDMQLLIRVISNIVNNAIQYTPEGSPILIRAGKDGDYAKVEVIDEGPGITDDHKELIFDMFYIADKVMDSRRSMGLGLYLSRKIIDAHDGDIEVYDNQPHGCNFTFTLPLASLEGIHA